MDDEISEEETDEEMEEEVEMEQEADEDEMDDYNEWPWHKAFNPEETRGCSAIANMVAQYTNRESIRANFYLHIEEPTQDLCDLAFDLFGHWGCVKDEFLHHPIKSETGDWGKELDRGEIILFEYITVDKEFRRQGIGKKLDQDLLSKVWPEPPKVKNDLMMRIGKTVCVNLPLSRLHLSNPVVTTLTIYPTKPRKSILKPVR